MNYSKIFLLGLLFLSVVANAQVAGNQVYRPHHSYGSSATVQPLMQRQIIRSTDSTLIVTAHILLNKRADQFEITVGVHQAASTIEKCNEEINKRIDALKADLQGLGIGQKKMYVDFISQTKIYDHEVGKSSSQQVQTGFELKKNLIFIVEDIKLMDEISVLCSKQEIYDIVKVEYINNDIDEAYDQLFDQAYSFIQKRRALFLKVCDQKLSGKSRITYDNFYSLYPKNRYVDYQAFESSDLRIYNSYYSNDYIRKEARKHKTHYYDGIDVSSFDKVINHADPEVGIQYVLQVEMVFEFEEEELFVEGKSEKGDGKK